MPYVARHTPSEHTSSAAQTTPLLGSVAAAHLLGVHRSTLHIAMKHGALTPDLVTAGGHARFREETLVAYAARTRQRRKPLLPSSKRPPSARQEQPTTTSALERLAQTLTTPVQAASVLLERLEEIQRGAPALCSLCVMEVISSGHAAPGLRIVVQQGWPQEWSQKWSQKRTQGGMEDLPADTGCMRAAEADVLLAQRVHRITDCAMRSAQRVVTTCQPPSGEAVAPSSARGVYAVYPLFWSSRLIGVFCVASVERDAMNTRLKRRLACAATELALVLGSQRQDHYRSLWLQAMTAASTADKSSLPSCLVQLADAFLLHFQAEDLFIQGPGVSIASRSPLLCALQAHLALGNDVAHASSSQSTWGQSRKQSFLVEQQQHQAGASLVGVARRIELGGSSLAVGALWRAFDPSGSSDLVSRSIQRTSITSSNTRHDEAQASRRRHLRAYEDALMTLAGVYLMSASSASDEGSPLYSA